MSDDIRPCRGENANVCVAEGCYSEACLRQQGTDGDSSWLTESPFGDLFDDWRRDDTYVIWYYEEGGYNMTLRVPASEWDTFLGHVESISVGIFMQV